ncbi:MAG: hypothetical protein ACK4FZ_14400 [Vogesella sp.]|uniref:hypothetical protein n=1 Tax=Vogesella sp. TaxID=1904252 RepID=UPI00391B487D
MHIKKILKSFFAHTLGTLVTLLDRLLMVPLVFANFHVSIANIWLISRAVPAILTSSDIGLSSEAGNRLTKLVNDEKYNEAELYYVTARLTVSAVSLILLVTYIVWIFSNGQAWLVSHNVGSITTGLVVLVSVGVYSFLLNQSQVTNAAFRSCGYDYVGVFITHCMRLAEITFFGLAIFIIKDLAISIVIFVMVRLIGNFYMIYKLSGLCAYSIGLSVSKYKFDILKVMIRPSLAFALLPLSMALIQQAPIFILSEKVSLMAAVVYSSTQTFVRVIAQLGLQVSRSIWPALISSDSSKDIDQLERRNNIQDFSFVLSAVFLLPVMLLMLFWGANIINYWTIGHVQVSQLQILLQSLASFFSAMWVISISSDLADSKHTKPMIFYIKSILIAFVFLLLLSEFLPKQYLLSNDVMAFIVMLLEFIMLSYVLRRNSKARGMSVLSILKNGFIVAFAFYREKKYG